jgi:hypothetical protein
MPHEPAAVDTTTDAPTDPGNKTADPYVTPIQQTLAAARTRSAKRKARWATSLADPKPAPPVANGPVAKGPLPGPARVLKCRVCGRSEPRTGTELRRLARGAWPMCCGQVMPPVPEPVAEPCSVEDADALPWADRRGADRRRARVGSRAEVRRGVLGMSPDLALKVIDVSESGAQVGLVVPLRAGEQVEVALWPPGGAQSVRGPAVICWCLPTATGEFRAGLRMRRRLTAQVLDLLAERPLGDRRD